MSLYTGSKKGKRNKKGRKDDDDNLHWSFTTISLPNPLESSIFNSHLLFWLIVVLNGTTVNN
jgi:hypothetical protein